MAKLQKGEVCGLRGLRVYGVSLAILLYTVVLEKGSTKSGNSPTLTKGRGAPV
jgi:hypothetical protein